MFSITLKFLEAVKRNNSTEWLHAHRDLYQQEKKRFSQFVEAFLVEAKSMHPILEDLQVKDCIYRFNRDLRFSKDGKPYKENFGAIFAYGGKKSDFPCFYFHLEPGASFLGGGVYMPTSSSESKVRKHLLRNYHRREKLSGAPTFSKFYRLWDVPHHYKTTWKLKQLIKTDPTLLSELSPALKKYCLLDEANPSQSPISSSSSEQVLKQVAYFKDWIFEHSLSDAELCEQELLGKFVEAYRLILPLLEFLEEAYSL